MRLTLIIFVIFLSYSCKSKIEIKYPKRISATVYKTNKYHIGNGLYEHKVMYTYSIDSNRYYGEFIAKDYTRSHSSGYHVSEIVSIKYDTLNPEKSVVSRFNASFKNMKPIKLD